LRRADLPLAPDRLRQVLLDLPSGAPTTKRTRQLSRDLMRIAAALAVFATVGAAVYFGRDWLPAVGPAQSQRPSPTVEATQTPLPSPSTSPSARSTIEPSPAALLPAPQQLLHDYPEAEVAFARSVGPADRPVSDDVRVDEIDLGPLQFSRVVLGGACLGPGELTIEARWLNVPGATDPFAALSRPCDGQETVIRYQAAFDDAALEVRRVVVPVGASWRFVIGALSEPTAAPATFAPITGTDGWWRLWDVEVDEVDPSTGTGAGVRVADDVTRLGLWIECPDGEEVTLQILHDSPSSNEDVSVPMACSATAPDRYDVVVASGEEISVKVTPTSPIAIHVYIEANAMPVSTWGDLPDLPAAVAGAPFVATNGSLVALGTLGGTRQNLVPVAGVGPFNRPGGEFVAIAVNSVERTSLHLFAVGSGESVRVIAEHDPGTWITETWVDPIHEQAFYTSLSQATQTVDSYRVALDGTGRVLLASGASDGATTRASLSLDYANFVVDTCAARACHRTDVDAATLEARELDFILRAELCDDAGVTDGLVVLRVAASCAASPPEEVVVVNVDGQELLTIPDPGFVLLVRTTDGPVLMTRGLTDSGLQLVDLRTGSSNPLDVDAPALGPVSGVQLTPDWVLLGPFSGIGDFPIHPSILFGQPPLLVNVVTGETIEMTNLPH
ncbi:MAG: hypothetical protein ABIP53_07620, partial [Candidatus Limnocylindrales bacterium]